MKKKTVAIAAAFASLVGMNQVNKTVLVNDNVKPTKEVAVIPEKKRKKESKVEIDPMPLDFGGGGNYFEPAHTSPFFNPTRSQRVKNKLNRKYYKR